MKPEPDALRPPECAKPHIRPWRSILFVVLLLLAAWAVNRFLRPIVAPWSLPSGDASGLFGEWSGAVALENGMTGTMVLELADNFEEQEGWSNLLIEGAARYCLGDSRGSFEVYGQADRKGTIADLRLRPVDDEPVWLLHEMSSRREGRQIVLSGTSSYDPTAAHIARSGVPEPAITIILQPGAAEESCPAP